MIHDVSDCNPLHRRIPGEITSRRAHPPTKKKVVVDDAIVAVDLQTAIMLKPDARPKWLTKACKMVAESRAASTDLFDIIVNRKFGSGLPERVRKKLATVVQESVDIFSERQRRYLNSTECALMAQSSRDEDADEGIDKEDGTEVKKRVFVENAAAKAEEREEKAAELRELLRDGQAAKLGQTVQRAPAREETSTWQTVTDETALKRHFREEEEQRRQAAVRRSGRNMNAFAALEEATEKAREAERRKKLEEEADNLFSRALITAPTTGDALARSSSPPSRSKASRGRRRSRSRSVSVRRSRSISSRTARRNMKQKDKERQREWQLERPRHGGGPAALAGSRAIFMSRDFVEDLPHMPRPSVPGTRVGRELDAPRIRSHSRSRGRRR